MGLPPSSSTEGTLAAPKHVQPVREIRVGVIHGPDAGKSADLSRGHAGTVGTLADNALVLADPMVSRYHLEIGPSAEGILLRDLGSLNGTFLGAVRVREATVPTGTRVQVGSSFLMLEAAREVPESVATQGALAIPGLVYESAPMLEVARTIASLATFPGAVLLEGETGTGKEVVANALHQLGPRSKGPFVVLDCGGIAATLLESQLFGHERGAFSGADRKHMGAFEQAHKGTLFLDEIGELPIAAQPALLGVLTRQNFRRLGGERGIDVDVRVIAATNRDLRAEVNRGAFRPDLYYRLAGARIVLPPLRERPEDIPGLVEHFAYEITGGASGFDEATMASIKLHHFAGNVRELRSMIELALTTGSSALGPFSEGSIAPTPSQPPPAPALETYRESRAGALARFERDYLAKLMAQTKGNASEAARLARMDRPYLLTLLRKHGLR